LYRFSRQSQLADESRKYFLPNVYLVPPFGMIPLEFHQDRWRQKTIVALSAWR